MRQAIANALVAASIITLVGLGFQLVLRVGKFFHFAQGSVFALAPYCLFFFASWMEFPYWVSALISLALITVLGLLMEFFCYRPIRSAGGSPNALLLCSLGIFIVLQSSLALGFGSETRTLRRAPVAEALQLAGVRLTAAQVMIIISSAVLVITTIALLRRTRLGKQMEAVASDPELARSVGIDIDRIYLFAIGFGSALGAIAGILTSYDIDMAPTMGMQPLMLGVTAVIIGGNTLWGTVAGAGLVGMAQHVGVIWLPSKWQDGIVFIILFTFLMLRPQGILGIPIRKATV